MSMTLSGLIEKS